jgi:hypothetical protein
MPSSGTSTSENIRKLADREQLPAVSRHFVELRIRAGFPALPTVQLIANDQGALAVTTAPDY